MWELVFYAFLTFFSAYGVFCFLFFLIDFVLERQYLREKTLYSVVFVKDEEELAEGIVRSLLFKLFKNDAGLSERRLIVVDTGSEDDTYSVLFELFNEKNGVNVMKKEEIVEKLEKI